MTCLSYCSVLSARMVHATLRNKRRDSRLPSTMVCVACALGVRRMCAVATSVVINNNRKYECTQTDAQILETRERLCIKPIILALPTHLACEMAVTISERRIEKEHAGDLSVTTRKVLSITTQLPPNSHGRIRHIAHGQRLAPPANVVASTPLRLTSAVFVNNTAA